MLTTDPFCRDYDRTSTLEAVAAGQLRTEASLKRKDNWGLKNDDPIEDARRQTVGSLGEMAIMHLFGQPFVATVNTFKAPDLVVNGWGLQVKASEHAKNLSIRPDAKDFEPYVLCKVIMPYGDPRYWEYPSLQAGLSIESTVEALGWMFPYIARLWADIDPTLWRDPQGRKAPAIFIPAQYLCSMESLLDLTSHPASEYNTV